MTREGKIKKMLEIAESQIGKSYKYGAYLETENNNDETPENFDCSSFIQYVFGKIEIELGRSSILQATANGEEIDGIEKAEPGDLIFFEGIRGHYHHGLFQGKKLYIGHVAVYSGNGKVIHATDNDLFSKIPGVVESPLSRLIDASYNVVLLKRLL